MRISVMEFGRFTAVNKVSGVAAGEDQLIILHGARERNREIVPLGHGCFNGGPLRSSAEALISELASWHLAFGCLRRMI